MDLFYTSNIDLTLPVNGIPYHAKHYQYRDIQAFASTASCFDAVVLTGTIYFLFSLSGGLILSSASFTPTSVSLQQQQVGN